MAEHPATRPADSMVRQVSRLLTEPGRPAHSAAALHRADHAFDLLDGLMRSGAHLPACWPTTGSTQEHHEVTAVYDAVSEALREVGGVTACLVALRRACTLWHTLDATLRTGAPLPEPWQR